MENEEIKVPHIEIKASPTRAKVFIDGNEIHGVKKFTLSADAGRMNTEEVPVQFTMELIASELTVDASLMPSLPEYYKGYFEPVKNPTPEDNSEEK